MTISDALLKEIFDAAPHNADGSRKFSAAQFAGATFEGTPGSTGRRSRATPGSAGRPSRVTPGSAGGTFEGDARFDEATFEGDAWFGETTFEGYARSSDVQGRPGSTRRPSSATPGSARRPSRARPVRHTQRTTTFEGYAWFRRGDLQGRRLVRQAPRNDDLQGPRLVHAGRPSRAIAGFGGATFEDDAWFASATFEGEMPVLGPIAVEEDA